MKELDLIPMSDRKYYEELENAYHKTLSILKTTQQSLRDNHTDAENNLILQAFAKELGYYKIEHHLVNYTFIVSIHKEIEERTYSFIDTICYHLEKKYNLSIDRSFSGKYTQGITLEQLLDEIVLQFNRLSLQDIVSKQQLNEISSLTERKHIRINGKRLTFLGFIPKETNVHKSHNVAQQIREKLFCLLKALQHFEHNTFPWRPGFLLILEHYQVSDSVSFFQKVDLLMEKAQYIRVFKNGNVEVCFTTTGLALSFADTYFFDEIF